MMTRRGKAGAGGGEEKEGKVEKERGKIPVSPWCEVNSMGIIGCQEFELLKFVMIAA